jgi:hypothetical protein
MTTVIVIVMVLLLIGVIILLVLAGRGRSGNKGEDPLSARLAEYSQQGEGVSLEEIELSQPFTDRVIKPALRHLRQFGNRVKRQPAEKPSTRSEAGENVTPQTSTHRGGGSLLKRIELAKPDDAASQEKTRQMLRENMNQIGPTVHMPSTGMLRRLWDGFHATGEKDNQEVTKRQIDVLDRLISRIKGPTKPPSKDSRTSAASIPISHPAELPIVIHQLETHPPTEEELEAARQRQAEREKFLESLSTPASTETSPDESSVESPLTEMTEALIPIQRETEESGTDPVDCTVMAPTQVKKRTTFLVQVFLHTTEQPELVKALAREFDPTARRLGYQPLEIDLPRGTQLTVELALTGLQVEEPLQGVKWLGRTTSVQFEVKVPSEVPIGSVVGKVIVHREELPIGCIHFKVEVVGARSSVSEQPVPTGLNARRYQEAFISYCSQDREEVLKRVQMLERFHIHIFQDILSIEPGSQWEMELFKHIDSCDLFLLFWSTAAKASPWVEREIRHALDRKGGDETAPPEIIPVLIEGPPVPAPPPYLSHLQFNDRFLYFMKSRQAD